MIDSGAECNSITRRCFTRLQLQEQRKKNDDCYQLFNYDQTAINDNNGIVNKEMKELTLKIQNHSERITLDIIDVPKDQIILGMPWLEVHEPHISWKKKQIQFTNCDCQQEKPKKEHWSNVIHPISEKGMDAYARRNKK